MIARPLGVSMTLIGIDIAIHNKPTIWHDILWYKMPNDSDYHTLSIRTTTLMLSVCT